MARVYNVARVALVMRRHDRRAWPRLPEVSTCLGRARARSAMRRRKGSRLNTADGPVQGAPLGAVRRGGPTAKRVGPDRGEGA